MIYSKTKIKRRSATRVFCLLCSILVLFSALTSCSGVSSLKNDGNGGYVDKKGDVRYVPASGCFEPASVGEEYRKIDKTTLYEIGDLDPSLWLCEKDSYNVFHSDEITIPDFANMTITEIKLCYQDKYIMEFASIKEKEVIDKVSDVYLNGEPGLGFATYPDHTVAVKVVFSECPNIYFCMNYAYNDDGEAYLTNRYEGKIIKADGLFDAYTIGSTEGETK